MFVGKIETGMERQVVKQRGDIMLLQPGDQLIPGFTGLERDVKNVPVDSCKIRYFRTFQVSLLFEGLQ